MPADDQSIHIENLTRRKSKNDFHFFGKIFSKEETIVGWLFMLPATILGALFVILPIMISLSYAFTNANLLRLDQIQLNGFANFIRAFEDPKIWIALKNTFTFVIFVVPLQLTTSLGLALLLNKIKRFNTFLRWAFFTPVMLSLAVTSMLWMNLLNPQDGLINALFLAFGGNPQLFLEDPNQAMPIIIFISAWQGAGYQMLIFLSGLKNIPKDLYEAASIDRASKWSQFWNITLPMLKPTFVFILITMLIGAFRIIVQPMIMTQGGPLNATLTMSYYIYMQGINFREVGYSSAIALMFTFIIASISLTLRRILGTEANT